MPSIHPEVSHIVPISFTFSQLKVLLDQVQQFYDAGEKVENVQDQLIDFFKEAPPAASDPAEFQYMSEVWRKAISHQYTGPVIAFACVNLQALSIQMCCDDSSIALIVLTSSDGVCSGQYSSSL